MNLIGADARASYRRLVVAHGTPAPGPDLGLKLPPLPARIADYGEDITAGLSVALAMPVSAIECLSPGDYMACINAVLEANRDFFGSWLLRPTMAAAARISEAAEDGQMSSPPLSPTDTQEQT